MHTSADELPDLCVTTHSVTNIQRNCTMCWEGDRVLGVLAQAQAERDSATDLAEAREAEVTRLLGSVAELRREVASLEARLVSSYERAAVGFLPCGCTV